ncbi:MAG: Gmad2 immunoglobulin-like domain-containing protein [Candidatus Moraniibacteriota bacterium]
MNKKISTTLAFSVIIILAIFLAGISFYLWKGIKTENSPLVNLPRKNKIVACTEEAKVCPDGSAVGRTAPNCEFSPCPEIVGIANKILITSLKPNDVISSQLSILGKAVGGWFFEADFPIEIYDGNDKKIGSKYCSFSPKTENETWMTEEFVDFKCELQFEKPKTDSGYIIFKKDNPSDMRELDEEFKLPVRFSKNIESVNPFAWRAYANENLGFKLGFPESWKGYVAMESNQPNDQSVSFSFNDGHQPFSIMTIRVVQENDWNNMSNKSALTKITQDSGKVYFCDGCCGQKGDTGGGQFDKFQRDRCNEAEKILQTFELIVNK